MSRAQDEFIPAAGPKSLASVDAPEQDAVSATGAAAVASLDYETGSARGAGYYRWVICAMLFFATTINYVDRLVLGILAPDLEKVFGWNEIHYGYITMAFQLSYAIGLMLVGWFMDVLGTRRGFAWAVGLWSVAAMAGGLARSAFQFGAARFALGISEAGNFPAAVKTVAEWFPKKERALATGIFNAGTNVGALIAPLVVPWIFINWGWQWAFIFGRRSASVPCG